MNAESCAFQRDKLTSTSALGVERGPMTAFDEHREELEHYETMMGPHRERGWLYRSIYNERTGAQLSQHGAALPRPGATPTRRQWTSALSRRRFAKGKELIQSVMEGLKKGQA